MDSGTKYYLNRGYKAVIVFVSEDIKSAIADLCIAIGCNNQEVCRDIFSDYISNPKSYKLNGDGGNNQISVYVEGTMHKALKMQAKENKRKLKHLLSSIVTSYVKHRSKLEGIRKGILGRHQKDSA